VEFRILGSLEIAVGAERLELGGQLMLALYRCDRAAEALQVYREARRTCGNRRWPRSTRPRLPLSIVNPQLRNFCPAS